VKALLCSALHGVGRRRHILVNKQLLWKWKIDFFKDNYGNGKTNKANQIN
jgi:hypothetical protein